MVNNNSRAIPYGTSSYEELWIEKMARVIKLDKLSEILTNKKDNGVYLLAILFFVTDLGVGRLMQLMKYGWWDWERTPLVLTLYIIGILFGIFSIKYMRKKYFETMDRLGFGAEENEKGNNFILSTKVKVIFWILGFLALLLIIGNHIYAATLNPSLIGDRTAAKTILRGGILSAIIIYSIWIIGYLTVITEFFSIFVGIHMLPRKIIRRKPKIDIFDPARCGGFRPIGLLFLVSSSFYFIGLLLYTYAQIANKTVGIGSTIFFYGAWLFGFALFFLPQILVHNYMKNEKNNLLNEVINKIKDLEFRMHKKFNKKIEDLETQIDSLRLYVMLDHIEKMKVWPFGIDIIRQLFLVAIIPLILNFFSNYIYSLDLL